MLDATKLHLEKQSKETMKAPFHLIILSLLGRIRMTPGRHALIEVLGKSPTPLSVEEILSTLKRHGVPLNKTTVYRELHFFRAQNLVQPVQLTDRKKRYELIYEGSQHHHHVVCQGCGSVEEVGVESMEKTLISLEKRLAPKVNFAKVSHNLEFFGQCNSCYKKKKKYV